ncbi:hypothetical protein CLAFUW4_07770 [Fulvia fulva]|uniref:Uncharacterized protein n=1 Tax=Passalora fulva TaxID=5499 RepID=A0A9Q8P654_PASFU|nr:uncharacterized protein CLAFUR5_07895 [Fulvia fulva]KAK4629597.1 hypothetical protein CLAFUR4_07775 [Fulvia fulva]KAK4630677.1 hypothetical protein CLAFUR0_07773 [Fulvia fulva]UJO14639.1 hypothetical protein CLAFUR5_07895 [Fulvia fulva]WPV12483.1 hypothetical protein CLAFUW4_07770 [Fulvia fulva]WPV27761.1 hypothetical protein CLAFUW7_07771 [Fulvia fulva]
MAYSFFEMTLRRRDLDQWEGTRQEMHLIHITLPQETTPVHFYSPPAPSCLETWSYHLDDPTLQGLEDHLLRQLAVAQTRQVKLCLWSQSWDKTLEAWQSFSLSKQFAIMVDGKDFANSDDLAAAAAEVAVHGECGVPYFEPPRTSEEQYWHMGWCYDRINLLIEWCQYHEKTFRMAAPALRKFRTAEELRALLPRRFGRWTWSQIRMVQLLMPCEKDAEVVNAITALFQPIIPGNMPTCTAPPAFALQCVDSAWMRDQGRRLECQERYVELREAWRVRALEDEEHERRMEQFRREIERDLFCEDDERNTLAGCARVTVKDTTSEEGKLFEWNPCASVWRPVNVH